MGRLGTKDVGLARSLLGDGVAGVMTHFATADEPGDELFPEQLERFGEFVEELRDDHPEAVVHAANSAATFRDPAAHFDMVRCGVALYGLDPFQGDPGSVGSSLRWRSSPGSARSGASRPGTVPATGAAGALPGRPGSPPCRSGTAMAGGAASRTARTC